MVAVIDSLRSYKLKTPAATAENVEITLRRIQEHMIRVPNGEFLMGSPIGETGRLDVEGPQRIVMIEAFEVGAFAVTMADFDLFVTASGYPVAGMCQLQKSGSLSQGRFEIQALNKRALIQPFA